MGIPGAAYLGKGMASGLATASVSPDGSAALAVQAGGNLMLYTGLRTATPLLATLNGSIAGADHFAWAPDSGSAAVYSSRTGQGQTITGVSKSPAASAPIDLSELPGAVTAFAFDGEWIVVGAASGGIYTASAAGVQRIAASANPSAIGLSASSLYFSDSQTQQVIQVQNYATAPAAVVFASDASINAPAGIEVSADGQRLFVANAGSRQLVAYDIASRSSIQNVALPVVPTRLDRFGDSSVFLLNGAGREPLYVVRDGGAGKAAVYFVPSPVKPHMLKAPVRPL